jgi:hypothetical protein
MKTGFGLIYSMRPPRWHVFMLIDHGLCCDNESNIFYVHFHVNFDVKGTGIYPELLINNKSFNGNNAARIMMMPLSVAQTSVFAY